MRWGEERDTDDAEGRVVGAARLRPTPRRSALLPRFTGKIEQVPPQFSAIKVDGERAYDLARDGEIVELGAAAGRDPSPRPGRKAGCRPCRVEAECGKGTYVRALARDLGRALGVFGHVCALRRTLVGPFGEADMIRWKSWRLCAIERRRRGHLADALCRLRPRWTTSRRWP